MSVVRASSIIILYAVCLHVVWGIALALDPAVANVTAIAGLCRIISTPVAACLFLMAAVLSVIGLRMRCPIAASGLMASQQILLLISAGGALEAMWMSQFADGVVRPRAFIIADQTPSVIAAIAHTWAMFRLARR